MNLRVDLIFPDEQRSASMLSMRSFTRVASIVGPATALLLIGFIVMNAFTLSRKVTHAEDEWSTIEPRKEQALKVLEAGQVNDGIFEEIEAWKRSGIEWTPQFIALQESIAPNIQLQMMRISQVLNQTDEGIAARTFNMTLNGTAVGRNAETAVEGLQKHCTEGDAFKDLVASASIPRYGADPENTANRIFELECTYESISFE